jgi:hypothetical protein
VYASQVGLPNKHHSLGSHVALDLKRSGMSWKGDSQLPRACCLVCLAFADAFRHQVAASSVQIGV